MGAREILNFDQGGSLKRQPCFQPLPSCTGELTPGNVPQPSAAAILDIFQEPSANKTPASWQQGWEPPKLQVFISSNASYPPASFPCPCQKGTPPPPHQTQNLTSPAPEPQGSFFRRSGAQQRAHGAAAEPPGRQLDDPVGHHAADLRLGPTNPWLTLGGEKRCHGSRPDMFQRGKKQRETNQFRKPFS